MTISSDTTLEKPNLNNMTGSKEPSINNSSKKPNVLLVEDVPLIQIIHKRFLEKLNCDVDIANDGIQALNMIHNPYDLILMDIGLPERSGIEISQEIRRSNSPNCSTPIIAVTALSQEEIKNECLQAGINHVAIKPLDLLQLKEILLQWLKTFASLTK